MVIICLNYSIVYLIPSVSETWVLLLSHFFSGKEEKNISVNLHVDKSSGRMKMGTQLIYHKTTWFRSVFISQFYFLKKRVSLNLNFHLQFFFPID